MNNFHTHENNYATVSHFDIPVEAFNYNEEWGNYASEVPFNIKWQRGQNYNNFVNGNDDLFDARSPHCINGATKAKITNKLAATNLFSYEYEKAKYDHALLPQKPWLAPILPQLLAQSSIIVATFESVVELLSDSDTMDDGCFQTNVPAKAKIIAKAASEYMLLHHPVPCRTYNHNLVLI